MTILRKKAALASAAAIVLFALAGCSSSPAPAEGGDDAAAGGSVEGKEICYITAANSHPYVTPANEGAQAAADAAGVELTIVSEEFAPQTGAEQLDSCVARGVDGILLWPLDDNSYLPGLMKAQQASIPVVAIDTTTGDESMKLIASFVGADKYDQGKISFEQLDAAMGGEGGVVILAGQAGNGTEIARTGGFMDALEASSSKLEVLSKVNADFDQQKALVASRDLLTKFGDQIKGVYAEDDTMAKGFAQALEESGLDINPFVVGINGEKGAFESIKAGTQYSTIIQPPFRNGELAIETLIAVMKGETVAEMVPLENTVVDASNVDSLEPAM
ncbi:sugar ABC transporter substrate-binding protein [Leucobacter soli]|uniref:Ribose import binding protein RbsB n=1 Tax=Leucobacter soli TaxID=2812850 RepID=A0A916K2D9_9MICO|nr:sugar ABC transporter substrate-binding protein [Leucobacter soli]CAG7616590.1 Ribose import binding protein RbsB [Leucobacter soli]